ncbi:hypothetical protein [Flavobacterium sp. KACC 22763]|uniref:hypothetical protein n=1 Tax=Flavobacterium sp. KACC 22763 TaxID=3025668 RepID=UPI0023653BF2|nr:hypothetical protein [Flavobacterium sp. KACC 22763]WDF65553.1 hypothetical protein PQ463_05165 [Flavobacterium sp. KACC 22763]
MKKIVFMLMLVFSAAAFSQTSKELLGKWKLVKQTKNGQVTQPEDTYQVFMDNNVFQGIAGDKTRKGKWKLSKDNQFLTISISVVSVRFKILYFDADKRTISSPELGTLEYEKAN